MFVGWSGVAKELGNLPVPGRSTYLDNSRARAYCACSRCGWGLFGHFFSSTFSLFFLPLWETARHRLKYWLKGLLNPKQPTNQPTYMFNRDAYSKGRFWLTRMSDPIDINVYIKRCDEQQQYHLQSAVAIFLVLIIWVLHLKGSPEGSRGAS